MSLNDKNSQNSKEKQKDTVGVKVYEEDGSQVTELTTPLKDGRMMKVKAFVGGNAEYGDQLHIHGVTISAMLDGKRKTDKNANVIIGGPNQQELICAISDAAAAIKAAQVNKSGFDKKAIIDAQQKLADSLFDADMTDVERGQVIKSYKTAEVSVGAKK